MIAKKHITNKTDYIIYFLEPLAIRVEMDSESNCFNLKSNFNLLLIQLTTYEGSLYDVSLNIHYIQENKNKYICHFSETYLGSLSNISSRLYFHLTLRLEGGMRKFQFYKFEMQIVG